VGPSEPFIAESAHRHGIDDEDILHAWRNAIDRILGDVTFDIGPDRTGSLLELGWVRTTDGEALIIHAMHARPKYLER
jgi:hypothetical protein